MPGNCDKVDCFPEETGCNHEGCAILSDCPHYIRVSAHGNVDTEVNKTKEDFYIRVPWTGNTLGIQDLNFLASSSSLTMIGITGVASAGKTTFLATLYCLLRSGYKIGNYQFSGSLTLTGWENIAWYLSWKRHNHIQFPPHTSSNAGRVPGLLHISLRGDQGQRKELIFTDAPGEWFDHWTANKNDPNAQGAAWIHQNADAFLLFADCQMLAGAQLGKARQQTKQVADRIKHNLGNRPFGLIWSKSDIVVEPDVKAQITRHITNSVISHYNEFETSVLKDGIHPFQENVVASIQWIISVLSNQRNKPIAISRHSPTDLFLSKREQ